MVTSRFLFNFALCLWFFWINFLNMQLLSFLTSTKSQITNRGKEQGTQNFATGCAWFLGKGSSFPNM